MSPLRVIRRWLAPYTNWRARRSLHRAIPQLAALDMQRADLSRHHRAGARAIDAERKRLVTERLRFELFGGTHEVAALESHAPRQA